MAQVHVVFDGMYGHIWPMALAVADGARQTSQNELKIARFQGRHVAEIASRLTRA
jgi:hypothetical protein